MTGIAHATTGVRFVTERLSHTLVRTYPFCLKPSPSEAYQMNLQCRIELAAKYKAGPQIARVLSEEWCMRELYCPACDSNRLTGSRPNNPAVDFTCAKCQQPFQLKSLSHWNPKKIVDAGYEAMLRAIRADMTPNYCHPSILPRLARAKPTAHS